MRALMIAGFLAGLVGVALATVSDAQEAPPAAPTELFAYDDAVEAAVWLSWQDNADNETSYTIERSTTGAEGPWDALATVPTAEVCRVPPATCWYLDYDIDQDVDYWYRVAAVSEAGQSAYSNVALAGPQPRPGHVRGVVFHDSDEDGRLDPGEEGLQYREVVLIQDGRTRESTGTAANGTFTLETEPGVFDLEVEVDQRQAGCVDTTFAFYPLGGSFCVAAPLPWTATTPHVISITVEDGGTVEINVGARPTNAAVIVGRAVLEAERAPEGTRIEALVDGRECGTTTTLADRELDFVINVLGEREREGCARRGDVVSFRVGGVLAAETTTWVPYTEVQQFLQIGYVDLAAMEDHAWYWMQVAATGLPGDGAPVRALVGDTTCGESVLQTSDGLSVYTDPPSAGFSKLIVPSDEVVAGCGSPGVTVTFTIDGVPAGSAIWRPGLQEVELGLHLPDTGSGHPEATEGWPRVLATLVLVMALAVTGRLVVALRR
jgi:hypothetical protein